MGNFRTCVRALLWRNYLYRKRRFVASFFEFALPILAISVLIPVKNAVKDSIFMQPRIIPPVFPTEQDTIIPLSFADYVTALQAKRICTKSGGRRPGRITGISSNWAVPFVKCDARKCDAPNIDAQQFCEFRSLALAPNNADTIAFRDWILDTNPILQDSGSFPFDHSFIQIFDSTEQIDEYVKSDNYGLQENVKIGAAIIIESGNPSYSYSIRVNSTNFNLPEKQERLVSVTTPPTTRKFENYARTPNTVCAPLLGNTKQGKYDDTCTGQYMYNGAITLQRLVDDWIIYDSGAEEKGTRVAENGVSFVTFPAKEYTLDGFFASIESFVPLLIVLGLMYPISNMIRMIVAEKEYKQKEMMKMMSVSESALELSWFLSYFFFFAPCAICLAIACQIVYDQSEFIPLALFWVLVMTTTILYSMWISSLFRKSTRAAMSGLMATFFGYFKSVRTDLNSSSHVDVILTSFHPVSTVSFAFQMIGSLENQGRGLTWETMKFADNAAEYSFVTAMKCLIVTAFIYALFTWYLNRVKKDSFGRPYPLYFPFLKSYWLGGSSGAKSGDEESESMLDFKSNSAKIEPVSDALKEQEFEGKSVEIRNLSKQFKDKTAVDGLSLSMYSGQVTALLGHNGAGKTTTINMLTGMIAPTSGYATVAGKDVRTEMHQIRQGIGICLQHDCLFPLLTVKEHIQFFAQIKGLYNKKSKIEANKSIQSSMEDVALAEKSDTYSKNLSGGMKRKLSVAIAFCGDSEVVFLDEPTSGMDPFSRRFTWNVIRQYRANRCIILTTHFMDEADLLGDRIAIMSEGQLRCVGSSLFLKNAYGVGYQLTIEKNQITGFRNDFYLLDVAEDEKSVEHKITHLVKESVPESTELSNVGTEISFQLPLTSSSQFPKMFASLDELVSTKNIVTYGVSITTLDEVFLMIARGEDSSFSAQGGEFKGSSLDDLCLTESYESGEDDLEKNGNLGDCVETNGVSLNEIRISDSDDINEADLEKVKSNKPYIGEIVGNKEFTRHVGALFLKRSKNFKRDKVAWCCSVLLPSILSLLGFISMRYSLIVKDLPPLTLTLDDYNIVEDGPKSHPIPYNTANQFKCRTGFCIQGGEAFELSATNEKYYMCGASTKLENNLVCSLSEVDDIVTKINDEGVILVEDKKSVDIDMMVQQIYDNSPLYKASQYGALYFNRDSSSKIVGGSNTLNGNLYNQSAISACLQNNGMYRTRGQCFNYAGVSYVVSTNFTSIHAPLLYQAIADEALVNEALNEDVSISASIHPLPITRDESTYGKADNSFTAWFVIIFSFPFITGSFATFIVTERQSKAKHLQTVAGVSPTAYWLSSFLWDVMNYQIPLWIVIIMLYSFDVSAFISTEKDVASGTIITLMLFGPASAAFTYCVTFLFESPSRCNFMVICFNFILGLAGPLIVYILDMLAFVPDLKHLADISSKVTWVLRWFPCFNLGKALFYIMNIPVMQFTAGRSIQSVWDPEILANEVIFLWFETFIYLGLAIQIDRSPRLRGVFSLLFDKCRSVPVKENAAELLDEDVVAENDRVASGEANGDYIVLNKLTKIYGRNKVAVDDLSLGIPAGQCFGLLGTNGAGKTTTMAMLTAEFPPYSGDACLGGYSVTTSPEETRRRIGYCPQFDAHFTNMTGREHVELYACIKGISSDQVRNAATAKLAEVGLSEKDSNKLSSTYSGGMKRKLSVACATIGQPPIVFLDEPSTGMDPVARRELWKVISRMVTSVGEDGEARTSVILTTHSMEECEALCPRIAIMANGKLKCLGSAQHLKSRFSKGYQVEMKIADVGHRDKDFLKTLNSLLSSTGFATVDIEADDIEKEVDENTSLDLRAAKTAVESLTRDTTISSLINLDDPVGYVIFKNASSSEGVSILELAAFCTSELRMQAVIKFLSEHYSSAALRERQDNKARFQVEDEDLKISTLFDLIEKSKSMLCLADYGISQTTLEQVFNLHAEAAENEKQK